MGKSPKTGQGPQGPQRAGAPATGGTVQMPGNGGLGTPMIDVPVTGGLVRPPQAPDMLPGSVGVNYQPGGAGDGSGITLQERLALAQMMAKNQGLSRRWGEGGGARGGGSGSSNRGGYGSSGRGTGPGGWG